jgi:hypothetical protein
MKRTGDQPGSPSLRGKREVFRSHWASVSNTTLACSPPLRELFRDGWGAEAEESAGETQNGGVDRLGIKVNPLIDPAQPAIHTASAGRRFPEEDRQRH